MKRKETLAQLIYRLVIEFEQQQAASNLNQDNTELDKTQISDSINSL